MVVRIAVESQDEELVSTALSKVSMLDSNAINSPDLLDPRALKQCKIVFQRH